MLKTTELNSLLSVIREEDKPLESVCSMFHKFFPKGDSFRAASVLFILCRDGLLTSGGQRMIAQYLLVDLYKNDPITGNPFLPLFLDVVQSNERDYLEKLFVSQLLVAPLKEVARKSVKVIKEID